MKTILHVVEIEAPPTEVYGAVLTPQGLSGWWSTKVTAGSTDVGGVVDFTFVADLNPDMEITEATDDRAVRWRCIGGHDKWADNTFGFEIEPLGDGRSRLTFIQNYAVELSDVDYGTYNFNWGYYLQSLKEYLETGTGKPYDPGP